jgi:predicted transcriptional regulator
MLATIDINDLRSSIAHCYNDLAKLANASQNRLDEPYTFIESAELEAKLRNMRRMVTVLLAIQDDKQGIHSLLLACPLTPVNLTYNES